MSGLVMVRNLWHDPHAKQKARTWTNGSTIDSTLSSDGVHWTYEMADGYGTINPFASDSNLSGVSPGMDVVCVACFEQLAWKLVRKSSMTVLMEDADAGLTVIRYSVRGLDPMMWYPYWEAVAGEPLTVLGLAVYMPQAWTVVEEAWTAGVLPTPIISYDLMPITRG